MSNLYRCHARVAYKPFKADYAIVFEERQIAQLEASLHINLSALTLGSGGAVGMTGMFETDSNTCRVTLTDPYLDGVAWTTLDEVNSLTGLAQLEGRNGGLLRKCKKGEDPAKVRCFPYAIIDNCETVNRKFPVIIITLWYVVGSQTVEQTFYYEVRGTSIKHGTSGMPTVTITGKHAFDVIAQQNIQPTFFEKNKAVVDELNEKIFKNEGYSIEDVCSDPADEPKTSRTYRVNNLTPKQILDAYVRTQAGSQVLSLPIKEFENKIQLCTKQDSSCYRSRVFYLGKGLYEGFTIRSEIPRSILARNVRRTTKNLPPGPSPSEDTTTYSVSIPDPKSTSEALKKVSSEAFSGFENQFSDLKDYNTGDATNVFKGSGNSETFTIEKSNNISKLGDAKSASAYLGGTVLEADLVGKSVKVRSKFYIQYCKDDFCGRAVVYQEFRNLKKISVENEEKLLGYNQPIGELEDDPQKKSKTRFFAKLRSGDTITLDPASIPSMVSISSTEICDESQLQNEGSPSDTGSETPEGNNEIIGYIGNTGLSSGPHLHAEFRNKGAGNDGTQPFIDAKALDEYITIGGKKPSAWVTTAPYGEIRGDRRHLGVDIGGEGINEEPIRVIKGKASGRGSAGGYGNFAAIDIGGGKELFLGHLQDEKFKPSKGEGENATSTTGAAKNKTFGNLSAEQDGIKITTKFKGIPKALGILPGRTMLSFVTDYDKWINSSKNPEIDPGVWIVDRYRNWYISKTQFKWDKGDLRTEVEAYIPWLYDGSKEQAIANIPVWEDYRVDKGFDDYYDYIRSPGDLCFKVDGKDSCSELCTKKAGQGSSNNGSSSSSDVDNKYARGKFTYTGDNQSAVQALLDAADAAGVKSNIGQAAIVGNAQKESFARLDPTAVGDNGSALGVFQWRLDRQDNLRALGNAPLSREQQMQWFVKELQQYPNLINYLNSSNITLDQAVKEFGEVYLVPGTPDYPTRIQNAQNILDNMK